MNVRSKWACIFSLRLLVKDGWAYLWTLTTPDEVDLKELSQRWRRLIWNGFTPCVRVFERHPGGHGYHVHFVTAERIDVDEFRPKAEAAGFGRIHVGRIPGEKARYVAKYLTKQRSSCPGVRLWSTVGFKGCKTKDVIIEDIYWDELKMIMSRYPDPSGYNFYARRELAVQKHAALLLDASKHEGDPNYRPPFPALFRHWRDNPDHATRKRKVWWVDPSTEGLGISGNSVGKEAS